MVNPASSLPPGFRFHPTDEELILHYLRNRATSSPCPVSIIAEVDIYKFDPWDLPAKATFGEREWYFFSPRDRKYPNGARPNRAAVSGYWKATGTDKPILTTAGNQNIGVKKALVFYKGRPPRGTKTNWIMHEYRLADSTHINKPIRLKESMRLDDWVLCRIYRKSNHLPRTMDQEHEQEEDPCIEDVLASLPNVTNQQTLKLHKSSSISDFLSDAADYSLLARLMYENSNSNADPQQHTPTIGYATNPSEPLSTNGAWSLQKLPRLETLLSENREFKRQRLVGNPQLGVFPSAIFNESTNQFGYPHYHQLPNQPLLNQQIPLNPQFEFQ